MGRSSHIIKLLCIPLLVWGCLYIIAPPNAHGQASASRLEGITIVSQTSDFLADQFIQPVGFTANGESTVSKDSGPQWTLAAIQRSLLKQTVTNFNANFVTQDDNRCQAVAFVLFPFHEFWWYPFLIARNSSSCLITVHTSAYRK